MAITTAHLPLLTEALKMLDSTSQGKSSRFSVNKQGKICLAIRRTNGEYRYPVFHTIKEAIKYIGTAHASRSAMRRPKPFHSSLL